MARGRECIFYYSDNRDEDKPGSEEPGRGQLVEIPKKEIPTAVELGYTPTSLIVKSPYSDPDVLFEKKIAFGMSIEDNEIIPFPNRKMTDQAAKMVTARYHNKSQR